MREEWDGTHKFWADKYLAELHETRAEVASLKAQLAAAREALERVTNALKAAVEWMPDDAEWRDGSTEQWVMRSIPVGRNALRLLAHPSSPEAPKESKP